MSDKQHSCWWEYEELKHALGRPNPIPGDRMSCRECGKVWVCAPGDRRWRGMAGWVPDTSEGVSADLIELVAKILYEETNPPRPGRSWPASDAEAVANAVKLGLDRDSVVGLREFYLRQARALHAAGLLRTPREWAP